MMQSHANSICQHLNCLHRSVCCFSAFSVLLTCAFGNSLTRCQKPTHFQSKVPCSVTVACSRRPHYNLPAVSSTATCLLFLFQYYPCSWSVLAFALPVGYIDFESKAPPELAAACSRRSHIPASNRLQRPVCCFSSSVTRVLGQY